SPASARKRQRTEWAAPAAGAVKTREQLRNDERSNLEAALAACHGKVFGPDGAAQLLGMKPTTLASRLKALGIQRARRGG
ncbi:MAG: histidine kinase, partial [Planctomycetota bacterium]